MTWQILGLFIVCNIINVIIQTAKTIVTVKGSKLTAAVVNAVAYGFYTYIIILTMCDLPVWLKAVIVGACNLVGVYVVKLIEERKHKDRLWLIQASVKTNNPKGIHDTLRACNISHNYLEVNNGYVIFNCYCNTQAETTKAKQVLDVYAAKYFASESKTIY